MKLDRRKILRSALRIAVHLAVIYLIIVGILYLIQSRLIYFPESDVTVTPEAVRLAYEDVRLETSDGVTIAAWYVPADRPKGTVLLCHGNAGNISHRLDTILTLNRLGMSVLIFDYRGYGNSAGKPGEEGTYLDAEAAWRHLVERRGIQPGRILVQGRSLGGAVAAHLARKHTPAALVLESTFTSITDFGAELYWWLPVRWMSRFDYDTAAYVREVKCPVLVVHSRDDEMIGFHHGQAIFDAAPKPKKLLEIHGSHNTGYDQSRDMYESALRAFIAEHVGRQ